MEKIPVTLLTGFLGAGKTTLLNNILEENTDEKIAIIVNEFGEVGIDDKLILRTNEEIIEMNNGTICCVMKTDATKVLLKLIENDELDFDRVIIETTGLADPVPIARLFLDKPALQAHYELDSIVAMVDAKYIEAQLLNRPEAKTQIAAADIILLNKTDLVDERQVAIVKHRLRQINPIAAIHSTTQSTLALDLILNSGAEQVYVHEYTHEDSSHHHDEDVISFVLREDQPLDLQKVAAWIGEFIMLNSQNLIRYKGLLNIHGMDERFVFQGVHEHFENRKDRRWNKGEEKISQVVVIGKDLDQPAFEESFKRLVA